MVYLLKIRTFQRWLNTNINKMFYLDSTGFSLMLFSVEDLMEAQDGLLYLIVMFPQSAAVLQSCRVFYDLDSFKSGGQLFSKVILKWSLFNVSHDHTGLVAFWEVYHRRKCLFYHVILGNLIAALVMMLKLITLLR